MDGVPVDHLARPRTRHSSASPPSTRTSRWRDNLDVVANLFLGREEVSKGPARITRQVDEVGMEHRSHELLERFAVTIPNVRTEVAALSGGQRQQVAVARSLLGEPKVVLLDEPTAALGVSQTAQVLLLIKQLRERGLGVMVISHNLADVFEVADRIFVLRLGHPAGAFDVGRTTQDEIVAAITGAHLHADQGEPRHERGNGRPRAPAAALAARAARRIARGDLVSVRVIVAIAVIWIIFQLENDRFLSAVNLTNLVLQITATGLISVGVVYVLLLGEIDLSVGAVSGVTSALMAVLNVQHGWNPYLAIAAALALGLAIGLLQGALFSSFGVPSFIITLAGLLAWEGLQLFVLGNTGSVNVTDGKIVGLANHFYSDAAGWVIAAVVIVTYAGTALLSLRSRRAAGLADTDATGPIVRIVIVAAATIAVVAVLNSDRGVPLAVLILIAFVAGMQYVATRTLFGRHVFAVGGNAEAARRAGIRIRRDPHHRVRHLRHDGGDRRHPRRVAAAGGGSVVGRQRPAAVRHRGSGDRRHEPVRRPRIGVVGSAGRDHDRVDLQRHGPARTPVVGQVHGHRRSAGRRRDRGRPGAAQPPRGHLIVADRHASCGPL